MKNLKNKKVISNLFKEGKYISSDDVLVKYLNTEPGFLYTVSSKKFKRAVDRNRIKRILRESTNGITPNKSIAIIYIGEGLPNLEKTKSTIKYLIDKIK